MSLRLTAALFLVSFVAAAPKKPVNDQSAASYLEKFGYIAPVPKLPPGVAADLLSSGDRMRQSLLRYQEFAGLPKTGVLDEATKDKMASPRCGHSDAAAMSSGVQAATKKWNTNSISYFIENNSKNMDINTVRQAISEAFGQWSNVVNLNFYEVGSATEANIKVKFGTYDHGDPWPFDGEGGTLAHATFPTDGKLHFDDDESWVYMDAQKILGGDYTDFLQVATHEAGHTIGLEHSKDKNAIMAPYYHVTKDSSGNYAQPVLTDNDIKAIQAIYDARTADNWGGGGGGGDNSNGGGWGDGGNGGGNGGGWDNGGGGGGPGWGGRGRWGGGWGGGPGGGGWRPPPGPGGGWGGGGGPGWGGRGRWGGGWGGGGPGPWGPPRSMGWGGGGGPWWRRRK